MGSPDLPHLAPKGEPSRASSQSLGRAWVLELVCACEKLLRTCGRGGSEKLVLGGHHGLVRVPPPIQRFVLCRSSAEPPLTPLAPSAHAGERRRHPHAWDAHPRRCGCQIARTPLTPLFICMQYCVGGLEPSRFRRAIFAGEDRRKRREKTYRASAAPAEGPGNQGGCGAGAGAQGGWQVPGQRGVRVCSG